MAEPTKVLVTGGAGFIGSHLVTRLLDCGCSVAVIDDLTAGHLRDVNHHAVFYHADINDPKIEQAWTSSSSHPPAEPSTATPEIIPCNEDTPVNPLTPYGMSKYAGELYLELFHRTYGLDYTILRYANVYGPGQNPHGEAGVVAIFAGLMLEGKQPTIYGDGTQERDFVFVSDVVDANIAAMRRGDGGTYNIGTGDPVNIGRVYGLLKEFTGFDKEPSYQPRRPGEVFSIALDSARATKDLDWRPTVQLEEGLKLAVDHIRDSTNRRPARVRLTPDRRRD
ncbi:Putative UDP-glucose 4-epimerase [Geodia barretti]|uniref:UDP-glucose 4-epimerase n=1 Tax=Geodia barretti TaxID=519541 RepID=A0AA35U1C8_GEOBA|nr:Putative UDP-glucose 4-epimerase [Geodia barretti]